MSFRHPLLFWLLFSLSYKSIEDMFCLASLEAPRGRSANLVTVITGDMSSTGAPKHRDTESIRICENSILYDFGLVVLICSVVKGWVLLCSRSFLTCKVDD